MIEKIKQFDMRNNHNPLKAASAFIGALVAAVLVGAVVALVDQEPIFNDEFSTFDEDVVQE